MSPIHPKPTAADLRAAQDATVPDVIGPGLRVLFCGINPSLYSAAVGHHFARPGNRFWPAIFRAGLVDRPMSPSEDRLLPALGLGITNVVERATATAAEVSADEFAAGGLRLAARVREHRPAVLAILGVTAYRTAFARPKAALGPQPEPIGDTRVWVLPNPSGLNAHYRLDDLARLYAALV